MHPYISQGVAAERVRDMRQRADTVRLARLARRRQRAAQAGTALPPARQPVTARQPVRETLSGQEACSHAALARQA
jgi:hypothetical protein